MVPRGWIILMFIIWFVFVFVKCLTDGLPWNLKHTITSPSDDLSSLWGTSDFEICPIFWFMTKWICRNYILTELLAWLHTPVLCLHANEQNKTWRHRANLLCRGPNNKTWNIIIIIIILIRTKVKVSNEKSCDLMLCCSSHVVNHQLVNDAKEVKQPLFNAAFPIKRFKYSIKMTN